MPSNSIASSIPATDKCCKDRKFDQTAPFSFYPNTVITSVDKALTTALRRLVRLPISPVATGSGTDTAAGSGAASGAGAALIAYRQISKNVSTKANFMMKALMRLRTLLEYSRYK